VDSGEETPVPEWIPPLGIKPIDHIQIERGRGGGRQHTTCWEGEVAIIAESYQTKRKNREKRGKGRGERLKTREFFT